MVETLQDAVKYRGSSLADEQYVDLFGKPGEYQHHHKVYAREGEACRAVPPRDRASSGRRPVDVLLRGLPGLSEGGLREEAPTARRHVWVSGRVQSVWFRDACRARGGRPRRRTAGCATSPTGASRPCSRARRASVDALVAWCRTGPAAARVRDVEVRDEMPTGEAGFAVR